MCIYIYIYIYDPGAPAQIARGGALRSIILVLVLIILLILIVMIVIILVIIMLSRRRRGSATWWGCSAGGPGRDAHFLHACARTHASVGVRARTRARVHTRQNAHTRMYASTRTWAWTLRVTIGLDTAKSNCSNAASCTCRSPGYIRFWQQVPAWGLREAVRLRAIILQWSHGTKTTTSHEDDHIALPCPWWTYDVMLGKYKLKAAVRPNRGLTLVTAVVTWKRLAAS